MSKKDYIAVIKEMVNGKSDATVCKNCHGYGNFFDVITRTYRDCSKCNGTGIIFKTEEENKNGRT